MDELTPGRPAVSFQQDGDTSMAPIVLNVPPERGDRLKVTPMWILSLQEYLSEVMKRAEDLNSQSHIPDNYIEVDDFRPEFDVSTYGNQFQEESTVLGFKMSRNGAQWR